MKRFGRLLVLSVATALACFAAGDVPAFAAKGNLLKNGSFEDGLDGWTINDETGKLTHTIDTKERAAGKKSVHLAKPASKGIANDRLQAGIAKIPAGRRVAVSARVKGDSLQNTWVKFFAYDAAGEPVIEDCDVVRLTGTFDWREVSREFDLPKEAVRAELRFCMFLGGELWVDDVKVEGDPAVVATGAKEAPAAATTGSETPLDPATRKWLDENAVAVKTVDLSAPLDDLRPLAAILKDVRIVQLGENTHGDGVCFEAKARLVRYLHEELGFDVLAFESGLWECDRANALLAKGDADGAMRASIFPIWHTKPVEALFRYAADRAKAKSPLTLAGFDCRRSAGEANRFLAELAETFGADAADVAPLAALETAMREQGDEYAPAAAALDAGLAAAARLRGWLDAGRAKLVEKHGEAEIALVSRALDTWVVNEAFERSKKRTDDAKAESTEAKWESVNRRDAAMAENLRWLADVRYPGRKIVTWGATFHLCRGIGGVKGGGETYEGCRNMGGAVAEAFGKSVYTVGFAASGGKAGTRFGRPFDLAKPKAGSVEDTLRRFGAPLLFVDLRRPGPFAGTLRMAPMGYGRDMEARWPDVLDAVFYVEEMKPAR